MISIAAVSDLHFKPADAGKVRARLEGVRNEADLLLLAGDLIDSGKPEDAQAFVTEAIVAGPANRGSTWQPRARHRAD